MTNRELALDTFRRAILIGEAARSLPFRYTAKCAAEASGTDVEEWHSAFKGVAAALLPLRDSMIEKAITLWQEGRE